MQSAKERFREGGLTTRLEVTTLISGVNPPVLFCTRARSGVSPSRVNIGILSTLFHGDRRHLKCSSLDIHGHDEVQR